MARRSNGGVAEALFRIGAVLPWWVGVLLAAGAYLFLHRYAIAEVPTAAAPGQTGQMMVGQMVKALATWGQYIVPVLLLFGAAASAIGRHKRQHLVAEVAGDASAQALRTMSWRDFELLTGEAFRMQGYAVTETGGGGADGGIDLALKKGSELFLVQCKHWKAYKVSVSVVRELYGVMAAQGAAGGFVVTSGVFTAEARSFAQGRNIELIDGTALKKMIESARLVVAAKVGEEPRAAAAPVAEPACPRCGSAMVIRVAKKGANAGKAFWGCSAYPQCRGMKAAD
ncbi:restriction endonuclease [Caldimonas tepidiphila]|uniref:restriction endonuclease n=1 Tax=Caldimonas tepidiphila TaxID=2315841 RepID=UPI000E5BCF29|nr:restriction endonuclease [Caldimonas tepidiphila]